jgi:hypothetical protein
MYVDSDRKVKVIVWANRIRLGYQKHENSLGDFGALGELIIYKLCLIRFIIPLTDWIGIKYEQAM